jgi:hypothetical protein
MKVNLRNILKWSLVVGSGVGLVLGCGKKDKSGSDTTTAADTEDKDITISGALALTGGSSASLALTSAADYDLYCVTFQIPPVSAKGDIGGDGSFSLVLSNAAGASVGCFVLDAAESVVGTMVFKDTTKKSLGGGAKSNEKMAFTGGETKLGTISLNLDTGLAEVDVSAITTKKTTTTAAAYALDFTGTYAFSSSGLTLPTGYNSICTEAEAQAEREKPSSGARKCDGPTEGMKIWLKQIKGKSTVDGSDVYGAMFWASEAAFQACGSKLGVTYDEAKSFGQIDLSGSGVAEGAFTWSAGYVDGWKNPAARVRYSMSKMENVADFNGYPGNKQYFKQYRKCEPNQPCGPGQGTITVAEGFSFNANTAETGCRKAGKPYQMRDWSNMQCTGAPLAGGLHKSTCTKKDTDEIDVTCVNIGGQFLADGSVLNNAWANYPADFISLARGPYCDLNGNNAYDAGEDAMNQGGDSYFCMVNGMQQPASAAILKPGQLCSEIDATTDLGKLTQLKCYAEDLHQNEKDGQGSETSCLRNVQSNFTATKPEDFITDSKGPVKARNMFVFEKFEYDSVNSGSLRGEERRFDGIRVGDNWTDCEIMEAFSFSIRKDEASTTGDLYGEMISTNTNLSDKPACIAAYGTGTVSKSLFKLIKQ